jgi:hypothetical protein
MVNQKIGKSKIRRDWFSHQKQNHENTVNTVILNLHDTKCISLAVLCKGIGFEPRNGFDNRAVIEKQST